MYVCLYLCVCLKKDMRTAEKCKVTAISLINIYLVALKNFTLLFDSRKLVKNLTAFCFLQLISDRLYMFFKIVTLKVSNVELLTEIVSNCIYTDPYTYCIRLKHEQCFVTSLTNFFHRVATAQQQNIT